MAEPGEQNEVERRSRTRQIGALALTGLAVVFAVVNLDEVSVNWIVGTWRTPLIIVIALSMVLGAGAGFLVGRRREQP